MTRRSSASASRSASISCREDGAGPRPRVLIGRDTRESGPHIAEQIARGLAASGAEAGFGGRADHARRGVAREPRRIRRRRGDFRIAQSVSRQWSETDFVVGNEISGCRGSRNRGLDPSPNGIAAAASERRRRPTGNNERSGAIGNEKLHEEYLGGLRAAVLPGAQIRGNENRARLRQRRGQQARRRNFFARSART